MNPYLVVWFISGVSSLAGIVIFLIHLFNRKLHKNPCKFKKILRFRQPTVDGHHHR